MEVLCVTKLKFIRMNACINWLVIDIMPAPWSTIRSTQACCWKMEKRKNSLFRSLRKFHRLNRSMTYVRMLLKPRPKSTESSRHVVIPIWAQSALVFTSSWGFTFTWPRHWSVGFFVFISLSRPFLLTHHRLYRSVNLSVRLDHEPLNCLFCRYRASCTWKSGYGKLFNYRHTKTVKPLDPKNSDLICVQKIGELHSRPKGIILLPEKVISCK